MASDIKVPQVIGRAATIIVMLTLGSAIAAEPRAPSETPIKRQAPSAQDIDARQYDRMRVGETDGVRIVVPTNQVLAPAGRQLAFSGRPNDAALSPDGRWLAVLDIGHVMTIEPESGKIIARVPHANGSYAGIVFTPDGKTLLASNIRGSIGVFGVADDGSLEARTPIKLPAPGSRADDVANSPTGPQPPAKRSTSGRAGSDNGLPIGLAIGPNGATLWTVLNLRNSLAEIDLKTGKVTRESEVGNAPYGVALVGDKAYVSNWAGRHPGQNDVSAAAGAGSPVRVDPRRFIASDGSVSIIDLKAGKQIAEIVVGLHPCAIVATHDGRHVIVANANSDTVSVINTARDQVVETISTRPAKKLIFGSAPNALALSSDDRTLYVSNGANNAVAVISFSPGKSRMLGCIPTGWYPAGLTLDRRRKALYVANVKGVGSRNLEEQKDRKIGDKPGYGFNSHDYLGTVSLMRVPTTEELAKQTQTVLTNNRLTESVSALAPPRSGVAVRPIPERHGEPSVFKHVLYIIKENRTYDQVFGDIERGEGDPELCIFGREVTPNHHKLVDEFVLLDNFYCSGVLSADGHQWTNEAYATDYIEKAFGGWPRSYPYWGGDAMAYSSGGFIWDNVLAHQKTLRDYGEFVTASVKWMNAARKTRPGFIECYRDFVDRRGEIDIRGAATVKSLEPHLCPTAIGFPSIVPDIYRAEQFIKELKDFEKQGQLPNFMIMMLPNDHTSGTRPKMPTPAAAVADNDLALGRIIDALSHSKFWPETCVFVVQDDPQNGFDHVDGHRTVGLVVSPYTRRHALDSTNYNQTSMVRTMELILGLPPMNQFDASATAMTSCFTDTPDLTPYAATPNLIPLDKLNPELSDIRDDAERHWAQVSLDLPLDEVDEADEDTLNRVLWHAARGRDDTYPAWAVLGEVEEDDE